MTNISKCYILATSGTITHSHSYEDYCLGGNRITINSITRDLGIMVNGSRKFHNYVNHIITKANRTLSLINRTLQYRGPEIIIKLYKSLVRPQLEYGNIIW